MKKWFECKIRTTKNMENGSVKEVTESYLVDALSFSEAEKRIFIEMEPFYKVFDVVNITPVEYSELFDSCDSADKWFKAKLVYMTMTDSGREKESSFNVLVRANSVRDAIKCIDVGMKDTTMDYRIKTVSETGIMDVFLYVSNEKEDAA